MRFKKKTLRGKRLKEVKENGQKTQSVYRDVPGVSSDAAVQLYAADIHVIRRENIGDEHNRGSGTGTGACICTCACSEGNFDINYVVIDNHTCCRVDIIKHVIGIGVDGSGGNGFYIRVCGS